MKFFKKARTKNGRIIHTALHFIIRIIFHFLINANSGQPCKLNIMIKNSLLFTLLFASDSVSSLQIQSRSANSVGESIDIFEQKQNRMAGEVEQSCKAGIERLTKGDSNSWAAFKNSLDVNTTWNDPGFPADETSLMWEEKFGRETKEYQPPVK